MRQHLTTAVLSCVGLSLLASCTAAPAATPAASAPAASAAGCIERYDASTDYFPDKVEVSDARNFSVTYHGSYKVVAVPQPTPGAPATVYVLVQCGAPTPDLTGDLAGAQAVQIPVARVATSSSTQIASLALLDALDVVVANDMPEAVVNADARAKVAGGTITGFGTGDGGYDLEKLVALDPDLVLQGGMPSDTWGKLTELGIPNVADASWLEPTPLGRAEWLKYIATFLGAEAKANEVFADMADAYATTRAQVADASARPLVLAGTQYNGTWTVPGSDSFVAALIADAGADYVFSDVSSENTMNLDNETILSRGASATIWINGNWMALTRWESRADALAEDPRVEVLQAVKDNQIWNPTLRIADNGGNDFWESGTVRPDLVLRDLAIVFHPDTFAGEEPYYYRQTTP